MCIQPRADTRIPAALACCLLDCLCACVNNVVVCSLFRRSLAEIEQLLLLPDRDPRLTALLPALQRSNSNVSSTGLPSGTTTVGGSTTTATAQC